MSNTSTTRPGRKRWRWLAAGTLGVAGVVAGWYGFRSYGLTKAQAQPGGAGAPAGAAAAADYDRRVVAYVYETDAITRQELGEYLIARRGAEKLEPVINRRIIDLACKARNIQVTAAQVEAALAESIQGLNVNRERFVKEYLKSVRKSLFEWKEDVLRPKLMLSNLCRNRVQLSEDEVRQAFESKYGEKVECRIIIWPVAQLQAAQEMYAKLRDNEEEFAKMAKSQVAPALASTGGKVKPIGRYTLSDREVEDALFKLRPGEVSTLIRGQQGVTLVKCDGRIPPVQSATLNNQSTREELTKAIFERKLQVEIGKYIQESRKQADIHYASENKEAAEKLSPQLAPSCGSPRRSG